MFISGAGYGLIIGGYQNTTMTENSSYIADLLVKSLIGNLSEEEQQLFDRWLAADERHSRVVKALLD